jgi:hypothetical protein
MAGRRRFAAAAAAGSPERVKMGSRTPFRMRRRPKEGGGYEDLYQGLGEVGEVPEE